MARWATYRHQGRDRVGVVSGEALHAISEDVGLLDLIARGADGLRAAAEGAMTSPAQVVAVADVELRAPIPEPPSVRDSLCFLDHMRNCQQVTGAGRTLSDTWYRVPAFYFACPATVFGPYQDVPTAPGSAWQDFELEIAAVVGAAGADLSVEQAQQAIVGYTIFNDWSGPRSSNAGQPARDRSIERQRQRHHVGSVSGHCRRAVTYFANGRLDLEVTALVNDKVIGSGSTSAMDWTFAEVISYASRGVPLRPGDVFGSGTVPTCTLIEHLDAGNPAAFVGWLHDGDVVTLRVRGLGETRQTVRATPAPYPLRTLENPDAAKSRPRVNRAAARVPYTRRPAQPRRPSVGVDSSRRRLRLEQRRADFR